jgi:hypothetical protein
MIRINRRVVLRGLAGLAGLAVAVSGEGCSGRSSGSASPSTDGGMMGRGGSSPSPGSGMMGSATSTDMSTYTEMFDRHTEIRRTVEQIPGGVRTTSESDDPALAAKLQAHVSAMYQHLNRRQEVTCMSASLPTLFRNSAGYRRQLTLTAKGVSVTETSSDPTITQAIRDHATEVTGFVRDGMPAMMRGMMGGG